MSYYLNHTVPILKYAHSNYRGMTVRDRQWNNDRFWLTATPQRIKNALRYDADTTRRYRDGWTLLERACIFSDDPAVIQELIDAGANPNSQTEDGWTPTLLASIYNRSSAVIRTLLENGASLLAKTEEGSGALHWAMIPRVPDIDGDHNMLIQSLIQSGLGLEERNNNDWTPLHAAEEFASASVV